MSAADILAVLTSLLSAAPQILTLFQQAQTGTPVTADQVNAALSQYGTDRVTVMAQIAAEKSAGD